MWENAMSFLLQVPLLHAPHFAWEGAVFITILDDAANTTNPLHRLSLGWFIPLTITGERERFTLVLDFLCDIPRALILQQIWNTNPETTFLTVVSTTRRRRPRGVS